MKSHYMRIRPNYTLCFLFLKKFQGVGFMWEENKIDVIRYKRHYSIEIRLFWIKTWFEYHKMIGNYQLFTEPKNLDLNSTTTYKITNT